MAISFRGCSLGAEAVDGAGTVLSIQKDGSVYLYSGLAENGQGLKTAFCQIAAEELGIDMKHITFLEANTLISPDSGSTVASRSTLVGGNSVLNAAMRARKALSEFLAGQYNVPAEGLVFKDSNIFTPDGKKLISFAEAANKAFWAGVQLSHVGWYVGGAKHPLGRGGRKGQSLLHLRLRLSDSRGRGRHGDGRGNGLEHGGRPRCGAGDKS